MKIQKTFQKMTLALLIVMLLSIPYVQAQSFGRYTTKSMAMNISQNGHSLSYFDPEESLGLLGSVAVGLFAFVTFGAGFLDGWDSVHPTPHSTPTFSNHSSNDFSKFDN